MGVVTGLAAIDWAVLGVTIAAIVGQRSWVSPRTKLSAVRTPRVRHAP